MKRLVDIVNFNADASCLDAGRWLAALAGGEESVLFRWLRLYIDLERPIALGFSGATAADIAGANPESVALIRAHPDIFQIIARPFSHDAALLRSPAGFAANFQLGLQALKRVFGRVAPFYLPPEFMLTPDQMLTLADAGIAVTFVNPSRYTPAQRLRIPNEPYEIRGALGSRLGCVPVDGELTRCYLRSLDVLSCEPWNARLDAIPSDTAFAWRDGESSFMFPHGLDREARWLRDETARVRCHLESHALLPVDAPVQADAYRSYPVHSLSAWMKEFRMMGYVRRVWETEQALHDMDATDAGLWLQSITSDVLSSVEKEDVQKCYAHPDHPGLSFSGILLRSERSAEGSDFLLLLERRLRGEDSSYLWSADEPHFVKTRYRIALLEELFDGRRCGEVVNAKQPVSLDC